MSPSLPRLECGLTGLLRQRQLLCLSAAGLSCPGGAVVPIPDLWPYGPFALSSAMKPEPWGRGMVEMSCLCTLTSVSFFTNHCLLIQRDFSEEVRAALIYG